jgi:cell division protein FtsL
MNGTLNGDEEQKEEDSLYQEKYKVTSKPLDLLKEPVDQLDLVLTVLDDDNWKPQTFQHIRHYVLNKKVRIPDKDLELAIEKLCDDNYVSVIENFDGRSPIQKSQNFPIAEKHYRITYLGRFFMNSVPDKYKGRPYRNQKAIDARNTFYTKTKTVLNVASTIIIIIIGTLGVYVTDKSNKLESTIDEMNRKIENKDQQIESLKKLTSDTVKHKTK